MRAGRSAGLLLWLWIGWWLAGPSLAQSLGPEVTLGQQVVAKVNAFRQQRGLAVLTVEDSLQQAAAQHSQSMAEDNFFDHQGRRPGQEDPMARARGAGFQGSGLAENLFMAQGYGWEALAEQCVHAWIHSPGHLANMVGPSWNTIGVGVATNAAGETYITALFGRR